MADPARSEAEKETPLAGESDEREVHLGRKIPIRNLYHLLAYAFDVRFLNWEEVKSVEDDDHAGYFELLSHVLVAGVKHVIKRGLDRGYRPVTEELRGVSGKLELSPSLSRVTLPQGKAVCTHDEFTSDILANRILKATLWRISRHPDSTKELKSEVQQLFYRMPEVSLAPVQPALVGRVRIHRNNQWYAFLMGLCGLILEGLSVKEGAGESDRKRQFQDVVEKQLHALFEQFVRNFYRQHLTVDGWKVHPRGKELRWDLISEQDGIGSELLVPRMVMDISMEHPDRRVIIDTKFYSGGGLTSSTAGSEGFVSSNMYQLNAYLTQLARDARNRKAKGNKPLHPRDEAAEGMLLYATVDNRDYEHHYRMEPHRFSVATVNLNQDWKAIESRLLELIQSQ
jgi:5-methylcytosine-specific restriction enzyme subunit McrC